MRLSYTLLNSEFINSFRLNDRCKPGKSTEQGAKILKWICWYTEHMYCSKAMCCGRYTV
jgi:hypothetical protein